MSEDFTGHTVSVKRRLFPFGFETIHSFAVESSPVKLSAFCNACAQHLIPAAAFSGGELRDIKGGDPAEHGDEGWLISRAAHENELFYVEGELLNEKFSLALTTPFVRFEGNHHIIFKGSVLEHGELSQHLPLTNAFPRIALLIPLRIAYMKISLDIFKSSRASVLGFSPVVTENVLIEGSDSTIRVRILSEGRAEVTRGPLENREITEALSKTLSAGLGLSLEKNYSAALGMGSNERLRR